MSRGRVDGGRSVFTKKCVEAKLALEDVLGKSDEGENENKSENCERRATCRDTRAYEDNPFFYQRSTVGSGLQPWTAGDMGFDCAPYMNKYFVNQ